MADGLSEELDSIPELAGRFSVRIPGAHALRFISRAGNQEFDGVLYNLWPLANIQLSDAQ